MFSFLFQKIFITGWRRRCETPCIDPKPIEGVDDNTSLLHSRFVISWNYRCSTS